MEKARVNIWQLACRTLILGAIMAIAFAFSPGATAQVFDIEQHTDSLWTLRLSDSTGCVTGSWQLHYPVFRFATADVNGDGSTDAVVGVFKSSRYFKTPSRRVFIFKNFDGDIRPLWLGSRLGGELIDFTVIGNKIRAIEKTSDGNYAVSDYAWHGFGMGFERLVAMCRTIDESYHFINQ